MKNLIIGVLLGMIIGVAMTDDIFMPKKQSVKAQIYVDELLIEELSYYRSVCEQKIQEL